jgi:predicted phosphatase
MPHNALANFIETENIAYFKQLLKTEAHPDKRAVLIQLLKEEEAKRDARIKARER